jgi:hypothetical protein
MDFFHLVSTSIRVQEHRAKQQQQREVSPTFVMPPPAPSIAATSSTTATATAAPTQQKEEKIDEQELQRKDGESPKEFGIRKIEAVIKTIKLPCSCNTIRDFCEAYRQIRHSCGVDVMCLMGIFRRSIKAEGQSNFVKQFKKCIEARAKFYFYDGDPTIPKLH